MIFFLSVIPRGKVGKSGTKKVIASFLLVSFLMHPVVTAYGQEDVSQSLAPLTSIETTSDQTMLPSVGEMDSGVPTLVTPISSTPTVSEQTIEPVGDVAPTTNVVPEVDLEPQIPDTTISEISAESKDLLPLDINSTSAQLEEKPTSYENSNFAYKKTTTPEANASSGALSYSYSIVTPPGRAGVEPSLGISYNSSENSNVNIVGYGWDFNIPTIERVNKQGNVIMYDQDYFTSSLSGELASTTVSGLYRPRVDSGEFLKYVYNSTNKNWKVYDKHGKTYTFGSIANSRNADPSNPSRVAKWYLDEIRDSNGNYISYNYSVIGGQVYPTEIIYTNHESSSGTITPGIYRVDFLYEDNRSDNALRSYRLAFLSTNARRLKTVEVKINNSTIRKYDFSYGTGVNGIRSVLASVTETGYSSEGLATIMPSTIFEYTKGFENSILPAGLDPANSSGKFSYALGSLFYGPERSGKVYADLNGDGYTDSFVLSVNPYESSSFSVQVDWNKLGSSGNGLLPYLRFAYVNRGPNSSSPEDTGARLADFNGDGFLDFVGIPTTLYNAGNCTLATCPPPPNPPTLYTHSGLNNTDNSYIYIATTTNIFSITKGSFLGDFDGSGLPKIYEKRTYLNDTNINNYQTSAVDINGDGLDDVNTSERYISFKINTGGSFGSINPALKSPLDQPVELNDRDGNDTGVRYMDINADGLIDVVRGWVLPDTPNFDNGYGTGDFNEVYINTGNEFVKSSTLKSPYFIKISPWNWKWWFQYQMTDYYDTNGDGLSDIPNGPTTKADILKTIIYPQGGKTLVEYTTSASGKKFNLKLPHNLWIVSRITTIDGVGGEEQIDTYTYAEGQNFFNGPYDRKFAGFGKVIKENDSSISVSYFHQGNGDNSQNGEVGDSYGKIGSMYKTEIFDKDGKLFARNQNIYSETPLVGVNSPGFVSSAPVFVYLSKKIEESFDGMSNHKDHVVEYSYDISNGNLISSTDYGEVNSSSTNILSSPNFTDIGNDKTTINFEYASNLATSSTTPLQVHYEVSHRTAISQAGNVISESKTYFDDLPSGQLSQGNGTKQESLISDGRYSITSATYNPFALVATSTDANGNATSYSYDSFNLYPLSVTNSQYQTKRYEYNYSFGKPIQITDINNQIYTKTYDAFGRTLEEKQPDNTATVAVGVSAPLVVKTTYQYSDTPNNISVKQTDRIDNSLSRESYIYFDGIGREVQTRKQSENPNTFIVSDVIYDSESRVGKQSLPYFGDGSGKTSATSDSSLYTSFTYDALGRNVQKTDALGTTNTYFSPGQTKITDTLGKSKIYYKDVFGRLTRVDEFNYPETYSTYYEYDSLGNLVKITDALQNVRNFTYDFFGRRLLAEDLHTPSDTTFGVYTYQYDNVGNLIVKTDPNGTQTNYSYDSLNRLGKIEVASSPFSTIPVGVRAIYTYDSCDFGIGKLCSVSSADDSVGANLEMNSTSYAYTPAGQAKTETKIIGGKTFISSYIYNLGGGVTEMTGVDSKKTSYTYNSAGLVDSISATGVSTTSPITLIGSFDYSPLGQPKTITYGNGSVTTNTYDPAQLYRLTNKKTLSANNLQLQNLSYTYDSVGNILQIVDNSETNTKKIATYTYDDLYRLVVASTTPFRQSYTYDALGNIKNKTEGTITSQNVSSLNFTKSSSQYAYIKNNLGIESGTMSVAMWVKFVSSPVGGLFALFGHGSSASRVTDGIQYLDNGDGTYRLRFTRFGSNSSTATYNVNLNDNKWHHLVYTYDNNSSTISGYVDGNYVAGASLPVYGFDRGNDNFVIGNMDDSDSVFAPAPHYHFDGKIDDVRVYNRVLSAEEISSAHSSPDEIRNLELGLVANYKLNNSYEDFTPNHFDLTSANSPMFSSEVPFTPMVPAGPVGTLHSYIYDGTNYANPHAPTAIGNSVATSTLSYDKNGNLISYGDTSYIYDYINRLISVTNGLSTSTYAYDHSGARVKVSDGKGGVTLYPSKYYNAGYNADGVLTSEVSHIFAGDTLLSTFENKTPVAPKSTNVNAGTCVIPETGDFTLTSSCTIIGSVTAPASVIVPVGKVLTVTADSTLFINLKTSKLLVKKGGGVLIKKGGAVKQTKIVNVVPSSALTYHLTDHFGSITLSTDTTGKISELTDYFPYGSIRVDEQSNNGSSQEQRKYIGQEYDNQTGLSYLNARYYDGLRGQFLNQDPEFWSTSQQWLADPQNQNSYSYARNNPITLSDPSGRSVWDVFTGASNAYISDLALGAGRIAPDYYSGDKGDYSLGQRVGDILGMLTGSAEIVGGSTLATGGSLVTVGSGGVAAVVSVPAAVAGAAITTHGAGVAGVSGYNFSNKNDGIANVNKPYSRPSGATTKIQRESVNKPGSICVTCGKSGVKMNADHKVPLVKEYYSKGKIDTQQMKSTSAVQPQCATCSAQQGGVLSNFSKTIKKMLGF